MNILVITRSVWRIDNSTGNTFANMFSFAENESDVKIHNLYFRSGIPNIPYVQTAFQINETDLLKGLITRKPAGKEIILADSDAADPKEDTERAVYNWSKKYSWAILNMVRDAVWFLGVWKSQALRSYLEKVKPDVIFMPAFGFWYPYSVLKYLRRCGCEVYALFLADEKYFLQKTLNPIAFLYRLGLHNRIGAATRHSSLNYVISDIQKREYDAAMGINSKILTKGGDFSQDKQIECKTSFDIENRLSLVFTGNLECERWKTLELIGKVIQKINAEKRFRVNLDVYTATELTTQMKAALTSYDGLNFCGSAPGSEIPVIQNAADILVHVEGFSNSARRMVRHSFSTKIVDYLQRGKCILAVGKSDVASIDYFIQNDAGLVAQSEAEIEAALRRVLETPKTLAEYGQKAWNVGKRNHSREVIQKMLLDDLRKIALQRVK